jgi:hypothetical protein
VLSRHFDEDEVFGLMRDADSEVIAHDAVPGGRGVTAVETLLDTSGDVLERGQTQEKPSSSIKPTAASIV